MPVIAFTPGEPAGIGFDLLLMIATRSFPAEILVFADPRILAARASKRSLQVHFDSDYRLHLDNKATAFRFQPFQCPYPEVFGNARVENVSYVLDTLRKASQACINQECQAMVTGPICKGIINQAGVPFKGHTEFLAALTHTPDVVMMLVANNLRVALATTHLPLKEVAASISQEKLQRTLKILHYDLQTKFNIKKPHILVCGLNPHAGEKGYLGREEIEIIEPALNALRAQKDFDITGPLAADTAFTEQHLKTADAILAMYHDQGLPVLKYAGFGQAVNITLGLPFIRTSVDHGTAFDKVGTNDIDDGSLLAALELAEQLI